MSRAFPVGAADDVSRALGVARRDISLSSEDVTKVASTAGVSEQAVEEVTPQVNQLPIWQRSLKAANQLNDATEGPTRDVAVGVACDGLKGEIKSVQDLKESLAQQVSELTDEEFEQLVADTIELWSAMYGAYSTGTDHDKAAVGLACWALGRAG